MTAVGRSPRPSEGLRVRLSGTWGRHKDHGVQFEFEALELAPPADRRGIVKFLSSDRFEGIGEVLAGRIVDALGNEALERIREDPTQLAGIKGLKPAVAEALAESLTAEFGSYRLHAFLLGLGLGPWQAEAVVERYGERTEEIVRRDPYVLARGVSGIGFATADRIAQALGLPPDGIERRRAGLFHAVEQAGGQGHSCLGAEELAAEARSLLDHEFSDADLCASATELARMRELVFDEAETGERAEPTPERLPLLRAWLPRLYAHEVDLAERLATLVGAGPWQPWATEEQLADFESRRGIELHPLQREAVLGLTRSGVALLTGGPGVGKTTIVRAVLELARAAGARVLLASPTGRAAKRLAEATDDEASTVHRLLGWDPAKKGFAHDADTPLETDLAIVDEVSMLDLSLARALVRAIRPPTRLVMVGDPDQLPSVAPGNVLADLLRSEVVPVWRLSKIFRQNAHSRIVSNAHAILEGRTPEFPAAGDPLSDFYLFPTEGEVPTANRLVEVVTQRIPATFGLDWLTDVQVLAPMYRGECGVDRINERLREQVPNAQREARLRGRVWREGDRVIHTRNDYERQVFNGDMGRVTRINADGSGLTVSFPDRAVFYAPENLGDLQAAFAITVHRSQGGEFPGVVMPLVTQHWMMLQRHLLYTAVTRAKRLVVLVGSPKALQMAVENADQRLRNSGLEDRLVRAIQGVEA
ncbi:MAG: ATP-dependent RecD-like DNA helicase [Planctomycetota bacterium]